MCGIFMKLQDIKPLSEALRHEDPQFSYDKQIDPQFENIYATPYSLYVNEVDKKMPHSITFLIASDDDDGVSWEVDLGEPTATSQNYERPSDHGPGGHELNWVRQRPTSKVTMQDNTNNPQLKTEAQHIQQLLQQYSANINDRWAQNVSEMFASELEHINYLQLRK
jgi:hypothetical protein